MISYNSIIGLIVVSLLSIMFLDSFAKKFNIFDVPQKLKIHKEKVTKTAGFGIIFIIICSLILFDYSQELNFSINILIFFVLIGFYDDIKNIGASTKIILMSIPTIFFITEVGLVTSLGEYKSFSLELKTLSFLFSFGCVLLLTNAFNYIDGMDGLLAVISITSLLFYVIILPKDAIKFIMPFVIFLSVFLLFNLKLLNSFPRVFMGDSGSLGIGFLFCVIVIHYTQNLNVIHESIAIWPIAFIVYEFLTINIIRIKNKKDPFKRDLNFIFNKFLDQYSKIKSLTLCGLINLFFCCLGYFFHVTKYYELSIFIFIIFYLIYFFLRLKQSKS